MTILVTGYCAPKGKTDVSELLVRSLIDEPTATIKSLGERIHLELLDPDRSSTESRHASQTEAFVKMLIEVRPEVCVFLGQANGRNRILFERLATNYLIDRRIVDEAPAAYWSTLPCFEELPAILEDMNIPAAHSNHAGTQLSNHLFYSALHLTLMESLPVRCGLVHLPLCPEQADDFPTMPTMDLNLQRVAVSTVLQAIAAQAPEATPF